jgi:hypothetical protein
MGGERGRRRSSTRDAKGAAKKTCEHSVNHEWLAAVNEGGALLDKVAT